MAEKRTSVYIERPPEDVFRYLIELNDARWRAPFPEMRLISEPYEGVGATHVEVRQMLGRRIETTASAVVYEPNWRWAVRRASGPIRPQVTYTLDPEGDGTRFTFEFDVPVLRGAARVLGPLVRIVAPMVERATVKDLQRLKAQLEKQTAWETRSRGEKR